MKRYFYRFIAVAVIFVLVLIIENYYTNEKNKKFEHIEVLVTSEHISEGTIINGDMFEIIKVLKTKQSDKFITDADSIIGKYAHNPIEVNQFVYLNQFGENIDYNLDNNHRLLTIKLSIEQSNGWHLKNGQIVDLLVVNEKEMTELVINDIKIYKIFNDQLEEIENPFYSEFLPQYASFIVDKEQLSLYLISKQNTKTYISVK